MVDMKANRIIDIIERREAEPVTEWLKSYPNLKVVSRDGSITYKNAIEVSHPKAIQVSDRFHLLKNLTGYAMDYLRKHLKAQIMIPSSKPPAHCAVEISAANKSRQLTSAEKYEKIVELRGLGYKKTHICRELNMDLRFYEKLIAMPQPEREALFTTNLNINHDEKVELKMKRVNEVRELKAVGYSNRAISRKVRLDHRTVAKYIDANFNPIHASYSQKKAGILSPYMQEIDSMLGAGMMGTALTQRLSEQGYTGSASTVRHYIADWKKRRKHIYFESCTPDEPMEIIERTDVFKLLFHPLEKVERISVDAFEKICTLYPCFQMVHAVVWEFRHLLKDKSHDKLDSWLKRAQALKIREIKSFVDGVTRDYEAVLNAVKFDYSNGLAEGKVNKLKLIKRIMYGRCRFSTLRNKVLLIENPVFFN